MSISYYAGHIKRDLTMCCWIHATDTNLLENLESSIQKKTACSLFEDLIQLIQELRYVS